MATQDTYTPWVTQRTNQCQNPVPSATTGYSGSSALTLTTMSDGTPCVQTVTTTATTPYVFGSPSASAVVSGETWVVSAMVEITGDTGVASYTVRGHANTGNVYFASGQQVIQTDATGKYAPQRVTLVVTPNAAVSAGDFNFTVVRTGVLTGVTIRVGKVQLEKTPAPGTPVQFDGTTTDPYPLEQFIWSGTAGASTSLDQTRAVLVPGDYIPVRSVATQDVLYGSRITSYRWEVLKHSVTTGLDTLVGTLDGVSDGSMTWTQNASVKGGGKIQVADLAVAKAGMLRVADIALESVRIRPVCVVQGLPENPLGVFLVSAATEQWEATGRVWSMELLDRCTVPSQDAVDSSYAVPAGTLILNQVKTLLASSNEYLAVDASNTLATQSGMVWEAGTSKLKIINDLLDVANYNALWIDGYGNFQTTPRILPADRPINYELLGYPKELIDGPTSIYQPDWTRDRDSFDVPNKVIAIQSAGGADAPALIGTWTNTDPTSPYSTVARGRTIPHVVDSVDCPAGTDPQVIAFLQQRARTTLIQMSATQATVKVTNLPIPVRVGDALRFANTDAKVDDRHIITRIQLDTTSLGLMQSTLQEVISL